MAPTPARDALSVIQTNLNQKQCLYTIDIIAGKMELLLPDIDPVGYHAWISDLL